MISAFATALSGLSADSTAIDVVGNDLANLNTTGYKSSEIQFADLLSQQLGTAANVSQIGMGVGQVTTYANYAQGTLQTTKGATDVALEGNGFFVVKDQNNQTLYTRDGSFSFNSSGQLTTATGELVQGWGATNGVVNSNAAIGNITVPTGTIPAVPTTTMNMSVNLNSVTSTTGTPSTFSTPIQVVDSLGATHTLTATFTNTGTGAWSYSLDIPAADLTSGGTTTVASGTLTFDSSGNLTSPDATTDPQPVAITGFADGAADMNIGWNFFKSDGTPYITQFAQSSAVSATSQNGVAAGQINQVSLQNGGVLVANYSNGEQLTIGQLAVASISNPQSLTAVGNNNLSASAATGDATIGTANTGSRGQIVAGALESSTVDISQEFTSLLTFERGYQANSRVITVSDQLLQETVNLIHG
jgi:flagellar hook protein FlgE